MALRPATPMEPYLDMLPELDMLLIMTVEPGFGGQAFLDVTLPKIRRARAAVDGSGVNQHGQPELCSFPAVSGLIRKWR
jgi:ribulose-phosphate 3-epimerase